ncbi:hypothetical protein ANN_21781 [Periplaneta americana]|uniref:Uncharacterized protein n=1 Tax=Periplaneta americana TaxID=6978 RepID=A0ABQ8S6D3_PERAM|nr:hypothetical protein ANN_21781 [Periplaneta americana]
MSETRGSSREIQVPKSTLQRTVHKRLKLYAYKVQLMQRLEPDDKPKRVEFVNTMLDSLGADPDLTPLDSFLWGYVKKKVYATPVRDLRDLRERIVESIESIPEDMLQRAWQEVVHRLDIVTVTAGAHVEICADKNSIKHTTMRVLLFQTIAPEITLPPQPVLTRWKTWLDAVNYYAKYYGKIREIADALDSTDSSAVAAVKSLPSEQLLEDILFLDSDFKIVSKGITMLESSKLQLSEALNIVYKVSQTVIENNNSLISEKVKCKLRNIIAKNSAYSQLRIINYVLSGHDKTSEVGVLKSSDFPFFKYASITSCDVERTFIQHKTL